MSSQGFSSGLNKAASETEAFGSKLKRGANNVFELGGALSTINKGWTVFKDILGGVGLAIGENIFKAFGKAISSLLGYDEAAEKAKQKTDEFIKSLREQADTIRLNAIEAARYKATQLGASKEQIAEAEDLTRYIEGQKQSKKNREEVEKTIAKLKEETELFGKSEAEVLNYRLSLANATGEQKRMAESLRSGLQSLKDNEERLKANAAAAEKWADAEKRAAETRAKALEQLNAKLEERDQFIQDMNDKPRELPTIRGFGTQDAFRRIAELTSGAKTDNEKQLRQLEKIEKAIRDLQNAPDAGGVTVDF